MKNLDNADNLDKIGIIMRNLDNLDDSNSPILNPHGPDREETKNLIETLAFVLNYRYASDKAKKTAQNMIDRFKKGYEQQSGEKYDLN